MSEPFLLRLAQLARGGDKAAQCTAMLLVAVSAMREEGFTEDMCREALERAMDEIREHEAIVRGAS